jgi:deoxyribodipyrimidine photolyase
MTNQPTPALLWFRLDLRLSDNPALAAALARGGAVLPVFIWAARRRGRVASRRRIAVVAASISHRA